MDLELKEKMFLVCGASSGFGRAISERLLQEGAHIVAVARGEEKLKALKDDFPEQVEIFSGDLTEKNTLSNLINKVNQKQLHGILLNAGGPPALSALETQMEQWDEAYYLVMRWKVELVLGLLPKMQKQQYGRIVFLESQSVKQPIPSLVLSNSFRVAVVGFAKTLALEVAKSGVTINILAPGSHSTPAIERVIQKRSENTGESLEKSKEKLAAEIPVGRLGKAEELASLAGWLLSPLSGFVTGQTVTHSGGNVNGIFG